MSLICVNKLAGLWCLALVFTVWSGPKVVNAIISNDLYELSARGDTLWMSSAGGINMTTDTAAPLTWQGHETANPWPMVAGENLVYAGLPNGKGLFIDKSTFSVNTFTIPWNSDLTADDTIGVYDAAWDGDILWLAMLDGGLVRWETTPNGTNSVWVPGLDTTIEIGKFEGLADPLAREALADSTTRASFWGNGLHTARPHSVTVVYPGTDSSLVYVACRERIWTLNPRDTLWDTLTTAYLEGKLPGFIDIEIDQSNPMRIVALATIAADTIVVRLNSTNTWEYVFGTDTRQSTPVALSFGPDSLLYIADREKIYLYTLGASIRLVELRKEFKARMVWARDDVGDALGLEIRDIAVEPRAPGQPWRLWIATGQGLFFEPFETDSATSDLLLARRSLAIQEGLAQSYAYPGILTVGWNGPVRTRFAYNLARDARVTIRIYDYNMDLVKVVTDNESRTAGSKRASGRSAIETDAWDGTNVAGRTVAPGVYYYKITTSTGERAFGKIIVALQR